MDSGVTDRKGRGMGRLVVEKGQDKGKAIPVPPGGTLLVGRDSSAGFQLRDAMASRLHFKIESRSDGAWLHDLESLNGTVLNGARVQEARLAGGDLIRVGETLFSWVADETAVSSFEGQRIGGYRILERLGRGGMGTVYKAEQIDLQRVVALKVISPEYVKDQDFVDLFIHEARASAKLNHPNIVQVYDVKRHDRYYYFSMEYVAGGNVQDLLNRQRRLPVDQAVAITLDAARGLEYAHRKGIVHRDVKPENFMISETGTVKIGDMGLARGLGEKVGPQEDQSVIGTPHYIAPEQVLGKDADFRSDIYSLGSALYRMLAGITPYNAPGVRDLVNKKVREDPAPLHEANPDVPRTLGAVVGRMMARDPERRFQSMSEVIAGLERFHREQAEEGSGREAAAAEGGVGSRRLLVGAIALLILVALGAFVGAYWFRAPSGGGGSGKTAEDRQRALQVLELRELKEMDPRDPRAIQSVIDAYRSFMEEFPATAEADHAAGRVVGLEKSRRELLAEKQLELLEQEDAAAYGRFQSAFAPRRLELGPVEAARQGYLAFAQGEEFGGTPAAGRAQGRAAHIEKWSQAVSKRKGEFEGALARAQALADQRRYREAAAGLKALAQAVRDAALECDFAKDRYRSLLYDAPAEAEARAVADRARSQWVAAEAEARTLGAKKSFEEALKLLDPVIQESLEDLAQEAQILRKDLENEWRDHTRVMIEEAEQRRQVLLKRAREAFEAESEAVRLLVLKYDFKGAHQRMKALRDANTVEDYRPALERRSAELERAAHLKDTLLNVINAKANPYGFRKEYRKGDLDGTIQAADEASIRVELKAGGTYNVLWTEFTPAGFYEFVKTQWRYGDKQIRDLNEQCDLAAVCAEFGLYEESLAEIATAMRSEAFARAAEPVRRFCEEYKERLEKGETAECDEVEARKRLGRLEGFMKAEKFGAARAELDALRARFARTKAVGDAQKRLDECLERVNKEGTEDERKSAREGAFQRLQAFVAEAQLAARRAQADLLVRINRLEDPFERNFNLGAVHAAAGEWDKSTRAYLEAKRLGEAMAARKDAGRELLAVLAYLYGELYRNYIVQKDKKAAEIRAEGARRFVDAKGEPEQGWNALIDWLSHWGERVYPEHQKLVERFREDVRSSPDSPQRIWSLGVSLSDGLHHLTEARGYFAWLQQNHPQFPQVQSGQCLWKLAELHYASREVREAIRLYRDLRDQHKGHPKVTDEVAYDGVKNRLGECYRLLNRMGYRAEKPR